MSADIAGLALNNPPPAAIASRGADLGSFHYPADESDMISAISLNVPGGEPGRLAMIRPEKKRSTSGSG